MDIGLLNEELRYHDLPSARGVVCVMVREIQGRVALDVKTVGRRRFGTDHVRWYPFIQWDGSEDPTSYGFESVEALVAEDVFAEFMDGFEGGIFNVVGVDVDGVRIVDGPV